MIPFGISGVFQITTAPSPPTTVTLGALGTVEHSKVCYTRNSQTLFNVCIKKYNSTQGEIALRHQTFANHFIHFSGQVALIKRHV